MAARQNFRLESLAEQSTALDTPQVKATLTFAPDAGGDYWALMSGAFTHSSTTDNHTGHIAVYHREAAVDLLSQIVRVKEASAPPDYVPFFNIAKLSFGASPGTQHLDVEIWSEVAGDTTKMKDVRILLIKADAEDVYAESLGQDSQSTTTYAAKVTLTVTPVTTGDFLMLAAASVSSDVNGSAMRCQLNYVTGGLTWGDKAWYCVDDFDYQPFAVMEKVNLASGSGKTFRLEYKANAGGTLAYIKEAKILALRWDKFENAWFASDHTGGNTTAATDQVKLTLNATPLAVDHAIIAVAAWNVASTSVSGYLR